MRACLLGRVTNAAPGADLLSVESQTPVADFGVWAFTVSFEMDYFNIIAMLRRAGVPPLAADRRDEGWPLLIAGGPAVSMNPEPMAPFFDAIIIGEAEELLPGLIELMHEGILDDERERLLDALDCCRAFTCPHAFDRARRAASSGYGCATCHASSRCHASIRPPPSLATGI